MSREAKLSIEFKFDSLVRSNWDQNQETSKNLRIDKKMSKNDGFRWFLKVSWFWAQFEHTKLPNSNSVDDFASLDTPGGPGGV